MSGEKKKPLNQHGIAPKWIVSSKKLHLKKKKSVIF